LAPKTRCSGGQIGGDFEDDLLVVPSLGIIEGRDQREY
jgi:hypothetical protein